MKKVKQVLRRPLYAALAFAVLAGVAIPSLMWRNASALQVTSRTIKMSSSTASASAQSYFVSFNPATTGTVGAIVVDFCADTPLVGTSSCTYPAGFTMGATPTAGTPTGFSTSTGSWVTTSSAQGGAAAGQTQTLFLTNGTAQTETGTGTPITFTISGVTNPSSTGTFYARIVTFDTDAHATAQYTVAGTTRGTALTNMKDSGGVALSTAAAITVTARVMESISFCVYPDVWPIGNSAGTGVCGNTPSLELGTGSPAVIDSLSVYTGKVKFDLSSNATNGVNVRLKGNTLTSGANTIAAVNAGAGAAGTITAGTAGFGLQVPTTTNTGGASPVGQVKADTNYDAASGYGFDTTSVDNVTTTYGDIIANSNSAPLNQITVPVTYGATASITTPAGIYTSNEQMIATGTF